MDILEEPIAPAQPTPTGGVGAPDDYFASMVKEVEATVKGTAAPEPKPAEAKAPETPKAEDKADDAPAADDIDAIEAPKSSSAAGESFNKIKETAKSYKARMEEAEKTAEALRQEVAAKEEGFTSKLKESETTQTKLAELEKMQEEFEEAQKELAIARVEGTKEYKDTITRPLNAIGERAKAIAKAADVPAEKLLDAIAERDIDAQRGLLDDILDGLRPVDQLALVRMAEDARVIFDRKDQIETDVSTAAKELTERQEKEQAAAREKQTKAFTGGVEHAASELKKKFAFVPLEDGETLEGVIGTLVEKAKGTDFDAASPGVKATAALATLALERAMIQMQQMATEIKELKARDSEKRSSEPSLGGGDAPSGKSHEKSDLIGGVAAALGVRGYSGMSAAERMISRGNG